ncbi:hypothetical protein [Comamonas testosteroni]|uniref:hypothetical protein n=1 Tax=Comamonas testosteroni TaxID=285 RepID=UPI0012FEF954|nr:hypothetical protein [Comamonas testosteroni]
MTEMEELQAQIDALRMLVISLIAQSPTDALIEDAKCRFDTWEYMNPPTVSGDDYRNLMLTERDRALQSMQILRKQYCDRNTQTRLTPKTPVN